MENKKLCKICGEIKDINEFSKDKKLKSGLHTYCKKCNATKCRKWYHSEKNHDKQLERNRIKNKKYPPTPKENKGVFKEENVDKLIKNTFILKKCSAGKKKYSNDTYNGFKKQYYDKYPEKRIVRNIVALNKFDTKLQKHHWSYGIENALDIIFIEKEVHPYIHRFMIYDQEHMKYRIKETNELLDTRMKHEAFINEIISKIIR